MVKMNQIYLIKKILKQISKVAAEILFKHNIIIRFFNKNNK